MALSSSAKPENGTSTQSEKVAAKKNFYEEEENLTKLCNFLRSKHGPPVRNAVMMDKRVLFLKGEKLVNFLVEPKKGTKWPSKLPRIETRQEAILICKDLCRLHYIHRSEKIGKGELEMSRIREFDETAYFTWIYEGDKSFSHLMSAFLIVGFLFCVCFPIWPTFLKIFAWYLSVTFMLAVICLISIRGLLFLFVWIIGYDFWLFPNIADETLGVVDSFKPLYSIEKSKEGQIYYRIGVAVAFSSFCYWAVTQPSEFDGFMVAQGDFLKDLYAGKLLPEKSQKDKENIDKPKLLSLDELLKKLDSGDDELSDVDVEVTEEEKLDSMMESLLKSSEELTEEE